ncbi:protein containing Peptidase S8 and S53, subtilisin, kexin, sedolisin [Candidatus Magnetomorum sp. HK-1]|nr:protein containing Peptidase S8 and S53, subtilisin, kexin, sedolisin [Candidatus Magnetomorum sp. HK-1]
MKKMRYQTNCCFILFQKFNFNEFIKIFFWIIPLLICITPTIMASTRSSQTRITTDQWAVKLTSGANPDLTARDMGAINLGQIAVLKDTYLFTIPATASLSQTTRKRVKKNTDIVWTQQQVRRWRFLRSKPYFEDPLFPEQWHLSNTGQHGGTQEADVHIIPAWDSGLSGDGIVIGIVDDGLQHKHPDLAPNYVANWSYDYNDRDPDPNPFLGSLYISGDSHGTSVAGVSAARENNDSCGVGAAFRARLAGLRLLASEISDADEAECLSHERDNIHIYNNSWGPADGEGLEGPGPLALAALEDNIKHGRNGLGNIYVFAAGNGLQQSDNVNYDGYANQRFVIAVSAVNQYGEQSYYSEPGACILVCAPSDGRSVGIYTTDLMGQDGYDFSGDCTGTFGGTSSAAPLVSGIIALILEKKPTLSWRDVQHILVKSAEKNDSSDSDWLTNSAGFWINHKYGFGRIHADHAVKLAGNWQTVSEEVTVASTKLYVNQDIPADTNLSLTSQIYIQDNLSIEHVAVVLTTNHNCTGQLEISLKSPSGTKSVLAQRHNANTPYDDWMLTSVRHWGESSIGTWTLEIVDQVSSCTGKLDQWQLFVYGEKQDSKVNQPPVAILDSIHTTKNKETIIFPLSNDFDADHDTLQLVSISTPINGKIVSFTNDSLTYIPNDGFTGIENLSYEISDQHVVQTGEIVIYVMDEVKNTSNQVLIIPDDNPIGVNSDIFLSSGGQIQTIDVHMNIKHANMQNISAYLISPDNIQILLFSNLSTSQTELDIHLNNTANKRISDAQSPYNGSYLPENSFDTIENAYAAGKWQLLIIDDVPGHTGSIESWDISIIFSTIGSKESPVARPDLIHIYPNTSFCLNVLENDTDPNGQKLTIQSIDQPLYGSALINPDCGIFYQSHSDFTGMDTLTYTVINEQSQTSKTQVDIIIATDLALSFNGINDSVSCGTPESLNIQDNITIELWINPTSFGELDVQGFGRLIDREKYILFLNETGRDDYADHSLMFAIEHPDGTLVMANTPLNSIKLNEWQHVAASYNSNQSVMSLYINGQKQALSYPFWRPNGIIANSQSNPFYMGESYNQDRAFQGMMDEVRIWKIVRTESDILSNMNTSFTSIPDDMVAYWPMRSIKTYLQDFGPNQLHCRMNSPVWVQGVIKSKATNIRAVQDSIYTLINTPLTFRPTDNDGLTASPVALVLTSITASSDSYGHINVLSDFSIEYTPNEGFIGTDSYQYTLTSYDGQQANASVLIHVVDDFSLYFENRTDYVDMGNSDKWKLEGPMTIQAWIKPIDTAPEKDEQLDYIIDKRVFALFINHLNSTYYLDNSLVYWSLQSNGNWFAVSTPDYSIKWNQWQHIAVFDDSKGDIQLFINGEKMPLLENGSLDLKRANHYAYPLILGNASDLQHGFQGWIDEVLVWSETRTQAEIQKSINACFFSKNSDLIAYWPATKYSQKLIDNSLNGLHGNIYGPKFQSGVLTRYSLSLDSLISSLAVMSGFSDASVCVEDIHNDLVFGMDDLLNLFHKVADQE